MDCPVCRSTERSVLYDGLRDRVFQAAPGRWTLRSCDRCSCAYLDPRPTAETIGAAYASYYTHASRPRREPRPHQLGPVKRVRVAARNGYLNERYGYDLRPAARRIGRLVARLVPAAQAAADCYVRRLPAWTGDRLLDVGCGNGSFLSRMQRLGWKPVGVEPDARSAAAARNAGLDVNEGQLLDVPFPPEQFGAITMSHVLEHLHEPVKGLRRCFELLRPGGLLWIATPNLGALGHRLFRRHWLHLDPPRHLVIFNAPALRTALSDIGFEMLPIGPIPGKARQSLLPSARMAKNADPFDSSERVSAPVRVGAMALDATLARPTSWAEELVVLARRPGQ